MAGKYQITKGNTSKKGIKCVLYSPEGAGKSTWASQWPLPVFIDTEGSTDCYETFDKLPKPSSWPELKDEIDYVAEERPCKTLVIDTIDWAEKLCINHVLQLKGWNGIEDAGYGNGYKYVNEEFARIFTNLDKVINAGINVILLAHSMVSKFEMPDDQGAYDRYSLKLINTPKCSNASLVKEWADMVLFANFRTIIVTDDKTKKTKGLNGQERVIYTQRTAAWDAKNRFNLQFEIPFKNPFDWKFMPMVHKSDEQPKPAKQPEQPRFNYETGNIDIKDGMNEEPPRIVDMPPLDKYEKGVYADIRNTYPALWDLMKANDISEESIRKVSASKGYFPEDAPIVNYPESYIAHIMQYKDEFINLAKNI